MESSHIENKQNNQVVNQKLNEYADLYKPWIEYNEKESMAIIKKINEGNKYPCLLTEKAIIDCWLKMTQDQFLEEIECIAEKVIDVICSSVWDGSEELLKLVNEKKSGLDALSSVRFLEVLFLKLTRTMLNLPNSVYGENYDLNKDPCHINEKINCVSDEASCCRKELCNMPGITREQRDKIRSLTNIELVMDEVSNFIGTDSRALIGLNIACLNEFLKLPGFLCGEYLKKEQTLENCNELIKKLEIDKLLQKKAMDVFNLLKNNCDALLLFLNNIGGVLLQFLNNNSAALELLLKNNSDALSLLKTDNIDALELLLKNNHGALLSLIKSKDESFFEYKNADFIFEVKKMVCEESAVLEENGFCQKTRLLDLVENISIIDFIVDHSLVKKISIIEGKVKRWTAADDDLRSLIFGFIKILRYARK